MSDDLRHAETFGAIRAHLERLDAERVHNLVAITEVKTLLINGLLHKVDVIEKRLWAVGGFALVTLIGVLIEILLSRLG